MQPSPQGSGPIRSSVSSSNIWWLDNTNTLHVYCVCVYEHAVCVWAHYGSWCQRVHARDRTGDFVWNYLTCVFVRIRVQGCAPVLVSFSFFVCVREMKGRITSLLLQDRVGLPGERTGGGEASEGRGCDRSCDTETMMVWRWVGGSNVYKREVGLE